MKKPENVRPVLILGLKTTEKAIERLFYFMGWFFFCIVCVLTFKIIRIFINI